MNHVVVPVEDGRKAGLLAQAHHILESETPIAVLQDDALFGPVVEGVQVRSRRGQGLLLVAASPAGVNHDLTRFIKTHEFKEFTMVR